MNVCSHNRYKDRMNYSLGQYQLVLRRNFMYLSNIVFDKRKKKETNSKKHLCQRKKTNKICNFILLKVDQNPKLNYVTRIYISFKT